MLEILLYDKDKPYIVTQRCANVSRSDSLDTLVQEVSFDYAFNRSDKLMQSMLTEPGDHFRFVNVLNDNETVIVEGLVDTTKDNLKGTVAVSGYDYGYWLNKNKVTIQFNGCSTSDAVKQLCKENDLNVECADISASVTKNYIDKTIGEVLKDLIGMATFTSEKKYRLEVRGDTIYIEDYKDLVVDARFIPDNGINYWGVDSTYNPGTMTLTRSLDGMYNHVKVMDGDKVVSEAKDDESIKKFGALEYTVTDNKEADATEVLKEVNKLVSTLEGVELLGDDNVRSGRILKFYEDEFKGDYLVTSCTHNYTSAGHTMTVDLVDAKSKDAAVQAVDPNADKEQSGKTDTGLPDGDYEISDGDYEIGDGIATGQYQWPLGAYCGITTYTGHTNNAGDFPVPQGTAVYAADGGVVNWVQYWDGYSRWGNQSYGNVIRISHGGGRTTLYAHLSRIMVRQGQQVSKGQQIGATGNTGNSDGPHMHMEIVHNAWGLYPGDVYGR